MGCTDAEKKAGRTKAQTLGYHTEFAPTNVTITTVNGNQVTFMPKGTANTVTVTWDLPHVWATCPTLPLSDVSGVAYLGDAYDQLPAASQALTRQKWPDELALDARVDQRPVNERNGMTRPDPSARWGYQDVPVQVTRLRIEAALPNEPATSYELVAAGLSLPFTLDLSSGAMSAVTVLVDGAPKTLTLAVLHAFISGRAEIVAEDVDLLDPEFGDAYQVLKIAKTGPSIVRLSQKGSSRFGVGFAP